MANQYTDDNPITLPSLNPIDAQQRRNWHFPAKMDNGLIVNSYGITRRNSEYAKHNVNKGLESNNPYNLGMALHTYLDSFAHEGYEAYFGHAASGHNPDRVHLDTNKFREAIWMTYSIIKQWYVNNGIQVNSSPIDMEKYMEWAKFVPPAYACTFCSYNDEINQRSSYWHSLVNSSFPEISLPKYSITEQCFVDDFEAAAKVHKTPVRSEDAWAIDWYSANFESILKANTYINEDLAKATASNCPSVTDPSNPFYGLNRGQAATVALDNPNTLGDGLPAILDTRSGITALFRAANQRESGWETLFLSASSAHNKGVNWSRYKGQLRSNLTAKKLERRLFAAGTLSILNDTTASTCKQINKLYSKVDPGALTQRQIAFLANTISASPTYIAQCTTESLPLLRALMNDVRVAGLAAARLYQITAAEEVSPGAVLISALGSTQTDAATDVRRESREALNAAPAAGQSRVLSQAAKTSMNSEIEYWSARSLQDFNDNTQGSVEDQQALAELERRLDMALDSNNLPLASGIASSIGTFTHADHPPASLISLVKNSIANNEYKTIRIELEYALHQLGRHP
jgi:hypothetical protein